MKNNWLSNFNIKTNYSLKSLSWFKVGGNAEYFYTPTNVSDLQILLSQLPEDLNITVLGAGSNILISDDGIKGLVLKLNFLNNIVLNNDCMLTVEAGALNLSVANFAYANLIGGLEFLSGIPGTIGGGLAMNAGAFDKEFKDIVSNVTFVDKKGNLETISNNDIGFSYRHNNLQKFAIFISANLFGVKSNAESIAKNMQDIKNARIKSQPTKVLTGGSTFANPEGYKAWELIDKVGLRGHVIGGACFSDKHTNFIVNFNNASFNDIDNLISLAKEKVYDKFNIKLKTEIKILQ